MKIAVFGAKGQVGTECCEQLIAVGYDVLPLTREDIDFSKPDQVRKKMPIIAPDFVINACAYTAVDKAESEVEIADLVNHQSVSMLAVSCKRLGIPLLHLSTDYVFAGDSDTPYKESDAVSPLGVYGKTKLEGEQAIQSAMEQYIILRTSWVFGVNGNNFVKTMLHLGRERETLQVVNDQFGRPSYVGDIVASIRFFVDRFVSEKTLPWGIYHCSSEGVTTWYDFAVAIFQQALLSGQLSKIPNVSPIPSCAYPTPAPRPHYSVLNTDKLNRLMGYSLPHWRQGLNKLIHSL